MMLLKSQHLWWHESADADAGSFPITKEIRQSCKKASQTQTLAQKSKKGDVQKSEKEEEEDKRERRRGSWKKKRWKKWKSKNLMKNRKWNI